VNEPKPILKHQKAEKPLTCTTLKANFELNAVNATFYKEIGKNEIFLHS
jgi:hypothetical protein